MLHGDTRRDAFPSDVKAAVQYGENLQALSVALNTMSAASIKRTHEILSGVFYIPIATGTISSMVKRCADSLGETVGKIKDKMIGSSLEHFDETGTRADKKL
ncbi:MAG: transposase [Lachnospiraceae bacterium]